MIYPPFPVIDKDKLFSLPSSQILMLSVKVSNLSLKESPRHLISQTLRGVFFTRQDSPKLTI